MKVGARPDPKSILPAWPAQAAFMRAQCCMTFLQPFMTEAEYLSVRGEIARWDTATDDAASPKHLKGGLARKTAGYLPR